MSKRISNDTTQLFLLILISDFYPCNKLHNRVSAYAYTGLAIDVCLEKDGRRIDDNDEMIAEKEIFAKVHEKLAKYGFILRYGFLHYYIRRLL